MSIKHITQIHINAPPKLVYELIVSLITGNLPADEPAKVRSRTSNVIIAELKSKGGFRVYSTVDKFTLSPHRRISFEQIEGPLLSNRGEINLTEIEDGTDLEFHGEFVGSVIPVIGYLVETINVRPIYTAVITRHLLRIQTIAESRTGRQPSVPHTP